MTSYDNRNNIPLSVRRRRLLQAAGASLAALGNVGTIAGEADSQQSTTPTEGTEIADWHDMNEIREDLSGDYVLVDDLDADTNGYDEYVAAPDKGWEPIGDLSNPFEGTFHGNGNTVSDLKIGQSSENYVGLFKLNHGELREVQISESSVTGNRRVGLLVGWNLEGTIVDSVAEGEATGQESSVGGLVGKNIGTIRSSRANCTVTGNFDVGDRVGAAGGLVGSNNGNIVDSYATGSLTATYLAGGLVGVTGSDGTVTASYATGSVTGRWDVGGLIGNHNGTIQKSYSNSEVTVDANEETSGGGGGLVGHNNGDITNCYSLSTVTGLAFLGGLVGANNGSLRGSYAAGSVTNNENPTGGVIGSHDHASSATSLYWDKEMTGQDEGIGVTTGQDEATRGHETDGVTGLETEQMQGEVATNNMDALDFEDTWKTSDGYPKLTWQTETDGFDSTVHGFGFANYDTPDSIGFENLLTIVEGSLMSELRNYDVLSGSPSPLGKKTALAGLWYTANEGGLTNGHCLGMVLTAREYYNNGIPTLRDYEPDYTDGVPAVTRYALNSSADVPYSINTPPQSPADIINNPEEDSTLDPVESTIDRRQQSQAFDSSHALRYIAATEAPTEGSGSINHTAVIKDLKRRLDDDQLVPISLAKTIQSGHVVLAYDLTIRPPDEATLIEDARIVNVQVYDPDRSAVDYVERSQSRSELSFGRNSTDDEFKMDEYTSGAGTSYQKAFLIQNVDPDYRYFKGGRESFKTVLSQGFENWLSVGVMSPVTLDVTGPDGNELHQLDIDTEQLRAETGYEDFYFGFGVTPGEYTIDVHGTGSGEYTIEVQGTTSNGGTISENITGTTDEGETHKIAATIPGNSDEEGEMRLEDPSHNNEQSADDGGIGFGIGSALTGIGVVTYILKNRLTDQETEPT